MRFRSEPVHTLTLRWLRCAHLSHSCAHTLLATRSGAMTSTRSTAQPSSRSDAAVRLLVVLPRPISKSNMHRLRDLIKSTARVWYSCRSDRVSMVDGLQRVDDQNRAAEHPAPFVVTALFFCRLFAWAFTLDKINAATWQRHDSVRNRTPCRAGELLTLAAQRLDALYKGLFNVSFKHFCTPLHTAAFQPRQGRRDNPRRRGTSLASPSVAWHRLTLERGYCLWRSVYTHQTPRTLTGKSGQLCLAFHRATPRHL